MCRVKSEPDFSAKRISSTSTSPSHSLAEDQGPPSKLAKLEPRPVEETGLGPWSGEWQHNSSQEMELGLSFVPLEPLETGPEPGPIEPLIPNRRIAVSDILPLTLSSGQVTSPRTNL